jgi:hypothetical protein
MRTALPLAALALVAAGCAATPRDRERAAAEQASTEQRLAAEFAGLTPGEPVDCLPITRTQNYSVKGYDDVLVYRVSSKLKYRNDAGPGCSGVGRNDDVLVTVSPTGRLCRGDMARTVGRGSRINTGGCALGAFVPYRAAS